MIDPFIVDFYCPEHRLIVEVEGDVHDVEEVKLRDAFRQSELERQGYRVLRISSKDVVSNLSGVLKAIALACGIENPRV